MTTDQVTAVPTTPTPTTFAELVLPDEVRDRLGAALLALPDPTPDVDRSLARLRQLLAGLPLDQLQTLLDFGRHADTPGVLLVRNLPLDPVLPPTPVDGGPSREKTTFVAEGVLLGLSQLLGEPVGFTTEKNGQLIHDVVPVASGSTTQTNQSSGVFLNFHNDIVHDQTGRYDVSNPDFLVLLCLRPDAAGEAATGYADARDLCRRLDPAIVQTLRTRQFRLNAPGSYVRDAGGGTEILSDPVPIISGPPRYPEIAMSANGVFGLTAAADRALEEVQSACRDVAHEVRLEPGTALLINNRKGLHARSRFAARHDGTDRWLQRTYLRRNLWDLRHRQQPDDRRVH